MDPHDDAILRDSLHVLDSHRSDISQPLRLEVNAVAIWLQDTGGVAQDESLGPVDPSIGEEPIPQS